MTKKNSAARIGVLARRAEVGKGKTRLAATIGTRRAYEIYRELISITSTAIQESGLPATVYFEPRSGDEDVWTPDYFDYALQAQSANLGDRILAAIRDTLMSSDSSKAIIIGTDCPTISANLFQQASFFLDRHDAVLGASADGGYYLLGVRQAKPELVESIDWSTDRVADQTRDAVQNLGWTLSELPVLNDIDTEADWVDYKRNN